MRTLPARTIAVYRCRFPALGVPAMRGFLLRTAQRAAATLREWRRRSRSRAALAAFDERMLRDIGATRIDAENEMNKPFWRE